MTESRLQALEGTGEPLDRDARERLEWAYGCSLAGVRVHAGARADAVCGDAGAPAFAWRDHVVLSAAAARLPAPARERVVAHEVAHVAQKRLAAGGRFSPSRRPGGGAAVEREAHAAAAAACAGRRHAIRVPSAPEAVDRWGPAGHYYTVNYVARAAGVDAGRAERLAFYAQMADQVAEFDAIAVAKAAGLTAGVNAATVELVAAAPRLLLPIPEAILASSSLFMSPFGGGAGGTGGTPSSGAIGIVQRSFESVTGVGWARALAVIDYLITIHVGLHCLTGGPSAIARSVVARNVRAFVVEGIRDGGMKLGLALHAYGDTYAHSRLDDPARLYEYGLGHLLDMHEPDDISHPKRRPLYRDYGLGMYELLRPLAGGTPKLTADELGERLDAVAAIAGEDLQCDELIVRSAQIGATPDSTWRDIRALDAVPLKDFAYFDSGSGEMVKTQVVRLATDWRMQLQTSTDVDLRIIQTYASASQAGAFTGSSA